MSYCDYFWQATVDELKRGYFYNRSNDAYTCLICGKEFEEGVVYPVGDKLYSAKKTAEFHITEAHGSMFKYFLEMGKIYTGLTEHQKNLMLMFYHGYTDKEIVGKTGVGSTSTIRNQRFALREKYKQAKIIVAMTELMEERRKKQMADGDNMSVSKSETLVEIHRTATILDERYAITLAEKNDVLERYFDKNNRLIIKNFPVKEKKKIIILQHLAKEFEPNKNYTEKEVNSIISNFYEDIPTIRRYLIQYGFLDRESDGSIYWVKQ